MKGMVLNAACGTIVLCVVVAGSVTMLTNADAQTVLRFRDTPGAIAFQVRDYDRALVEFQKLRQANPNNTLILRYLGITLSELGRFKEAIDIFKEAIAIAPNKPSLHYHLGVTYYTARQPEAAIIAFRRVMQLAQDSQYAVLSGRYLDAIAQQQAEQQRPGAPQRFGIYAQAAYQRDDNILAVPGGSISTDIGDDRLTGFIKLDYYLQRSPVWLAMASVNGYNSRYRNDAFDSYEFPQYGGDLRLQRTGVLGNYPFIGSANYNYRKVDLADGESYSRSHALALGLRMNLTENTATYAYYNYTNDDFADEGFDPEISSRDADNHLLGLSQTWFFAGRSGQVSLGLDYEKNNAYGANFDMDGLTGKISAIIPLPWTMRLDLNLGYGQEDYSNFVGPVRRETDITSSSAALSRWFGRYFQASLNYSFRKENSSYEQLTYDRSVWGASISYVY